MQAPVTALSSSLTLEYAGIVPYPDLPPSPTFWRCAACDNETEFRASGTARIQCIKCGKVWTDQQLVEAHAAARSEPSARPKV